MTEEYLHQIWKNKRLRFHDLVPINGTDIYVKDIGVYNKNQKGPDFQFGIVHIDGLDFYGNIEIHVKSSDWYKHNHHQDEAYNSVILHVVYEYDKPVIQNGYLIPTLELKDQIDFNHYKKYTMKSVLNNEFPCSKLLGQLDPIYLESMKTKAYYERMNAKVELLNGLNLSKKSILYHLFATAFGTSINKQGFIDLTQKVPFKQLRRLLSSKQKSQLILAESGIVQKPKSSVDMSAWHFKGTRPKNFPIVRIRQFAHFVACYDFDLSFVLLTSEEIKAEFYKMIDDFWGTDSYQSQKISKSFSDLLLINAIVPFIWYESELLQDERLKDKAIELLEGIPPEMNNIISKWKNCAVDVKNSFDSQSLLSLYRYYCSTKKCISCGVGAKLLEN